MKRIIGLALLAISLAPMPMAQAKKAAPMEQLAPHTPMDFTEFEFSSVDKPDRNPSSNAGETLTESMMSAKARALRDKWIAAKTADEIHELALEAESQMSKYTDADAKFLAIQLSAIKPFRGFLYRIKPLIESQKITHSFALSAVKSMFIGMRSFNPGKLTEAMIGYLTEPYMANGRLPTPIKDARDFTRFLVNEVRGHQLIYVKNLSALDLSTPIVLDAQLVFGANSFRDGIERFRKIGELEKHFMISAAEQGLAQISFTRAYSQNNTVEVFQDVGKLYGFDGFLFSEIDGVTMKEITAALTDYKYRNTFVLEKDGKLWMADAYKLLSSSTKRFYAKVWGLGRSRESDSNFVINTAFMQADLARGEDNLKNAVNLITGVNPDGSTQLRSLITGEVTTFNVKAFFMNPPQDLKTLLPTKFETAKIRIKNFPANKGGSGPTAVEYRNFYYGTPKAWSKAAYGSLIPNNNSDVETASRVIAHSTNGLVRIPGLNVQ